MYSFDFWDLPFWEWFLFICEMVMIFSLIFSWTCLMWFIDLRFHAGIYRLGMLAEVCRLGMLGHTESFILACLLGFVDLGFVDLGFVDLGFVDLDLHAGICRLGFTCWDL